MKRGFAIALVLAGLLSAAARLSAQVPASGDAAGSGQSKPSSQGQQPAGAQPQTGSNPFPEDTSTVPLLPSKGTPVLPEGTYRGDEYGSGGARVALPGEDLDPVRSPDDPAPAAGSGQQEDSSSSLSGLDKLLPPPDDDQTGRMKKKEKEPTHQEAASEDINVGGYYLDRKNWKAAYSRFQSALILDPENPNVYWGLAEAERQLGNFADARMHYEKVLEYDPDSKHGKEARKALKDPAIANAKKAAAVAEPAK
jgi:tetratricopeptide (TPR) repeat protein